MWYILSFVLNNIIFKRISGIFPTTFTFMGEQYIQNTFQYTLHYNTAQHNITNHTNSAIRKNTTNHKSEYNQHLPDKTSTTTKKFNKGNTGL